MTRHRGRRSREDQLEQAILLFRQERVALEDDEAFAECRGVDAVVCVLHRETLKRGTALDLLIQGAVADVLAEMSAAQMPQALRLVQFLHYWFRERMTVVEIAALLHLDRSYVGRTIKGPALLLVAQRFIYLAQHEDPLEESAGVRDAVQMHEQRRMAAMERVAATQRPWDGDAPEVWARGAHRYIQRPLNGVAPT